MLSQTLALFLLTTSTLTIANPIRNPQPIDSTPARPARDSHALLPIQHYEGHHSTPIEPDRPFHWTRDLVARELIHQPAPQRADGENGYIGGLYMCTNYGYRGTCSYAKYPMSTCYNLLAPFYNNVSSFSPDNYAGDAIFAFECKIFDLEGRTGTSVRQSWPGTSNLWISGSAVDKRGKSVMCEVLEQEGRELYEEWRAQGYDFDREVQREKECLSFCESEPA
jgi:hypothetical protein